MKEKYKENCPDYLVDFLYFMQVIKNRSERTVNAYYIDLQVFLRYLKIKNHDIPKDTSFNTIEIKDVPFSYIQRFRLMDAYAYMRWLMDEKNNSSAARARKTSSLKQFYMYLYYYAGLIDNDPLSQLETPTVKSKLPKYLTLDECIRLLDAVSTSHVHRDLCILTLFLNCGMRLSELCNIDINDIKFSECTIRLHGKGGNERIIYLNDACMYALNAYLVLRDPKGTGTGALFLSAKKKRISRRRVQEIVEECIQQAGLSNKGITTHKLRHTAATLMYEHGGVDILIIKEILGHKNVTTTEIYTHLSSHKLRNAMITAPLANEKFADRKKKNKNT